MKVQRRKTRKKPTRPRAKVAGWRNRIVGHGEQPASQFLGNPAQWRIHPRTQETALASVLGSIGWVQSVVVNRRTGHLIDGHLRVATALAAADETPVPFVEVDLTLAEEKAILATFDPLSALAGQDDEKLDALVADIPPDFGIDLTAILQRDKAATRGLAHDVRPCTCCDVQCEPGCGCYRESKT